jgi:hypothetical protein
MHRKGAVMPHMGDRLVVKTLPSLLSFTQAGRREEKFGGNAQFRLYPIP